MSTYGESRLSRFSRLATRSLRREIRCNQQRSTTPTPRYWLTLSASLGASRGGSASSRTILLPCVSDYMKRLNSPRLYCCREGPARARETYLIALLPNWEIQESSHTALRLSQVSR